MLDTDKAIVFAEREGYRALELDIYRDGASTASPLPVVVFVHGGGWRVGHRRAPRETREWERGFFDRICDAGFVAVACSYRFSGEATFPAQIDDVVDALRWIRDHGAEHGLDPDRVYLWGASGGGTLAALAALVPEAPTVRGAVIWYAVERLPRPRPRSHRHVGGAPVRWADRRERRARAVSEPCLVRP